MREDKNTNRQNLKNLAPILYLLIKEYDLSKIHFVKKLYWSEWDENDEDIKQKLLVRFRNKFDSNGRLTAEELTQIQNILLEIADTIKQQVGIFALEQEKKLRRKEKIQMLLEHFDKLDDESLDNLDKSSIDKLKKEL